ncbi:hypothetical protein HA402_005910 [Bradysia odoriphaga]|nr:hypothetical protein HA402_005910 [Bradysia odoriphaga]
MSNSQITGDYVSDTSYVVVEMKYENDGVYVQFVPNIWVKPLKQNGKLAARSEAFCYFPRRLPGQSKDQHLKFVKNAKFICMPPESDRKWEVLKCRVLKIAIGIGDYNFAFTHDSISNEKTTGGPSVTKAKKPAIEAKRPKYSSDHDDSDPDHNTSGIGDYNFAFTHDIMSNGIDKTTAGPSESMTQDGTTTVQYVNQMQNDLGEFEQETAIDLERNSYVVQLDTIGSNFINQLEHQNQSICSEVHQLEASTNLTNCKCVEKLRNKIDYFQKRVMAEIADLRNEVLKSIRSLTEIVRRGSSNDPGPVSSDEDLSDELIEKYSLAIPANDQISLRAINQSIKTDADFKKFLNLEFEKISSVDAIKTARKMLNAVCTVKCFGQFTWLGTKEKERFSEFNHLIEFMIKILEKKFPKCGAYKILESVVKQRTKSAGEAVKESVKAASAKDVSKGPVAENSMFSAEPNVGPMLSDDIYVPFDPESLVQIDKMN